ncbi:MAG: succinate dehydrogenase cytochrome b subunit [Candidatus Omnitrophica bacterium]|nr:succinate dehydrogenase cytochrome b subunit [Candidatus Omnitrophota bacterium]
MIPAVSFLNSSIGRKAVSAVTGVLLMLFVMGHLAGNLTIFAGRDVINDYAGHLRDLGPLLWVIRFLLLATVILHIYTTVRLARDNRAARPVRYAREDTVQASWASRSMALSGIVLLAFIVYHLLHFTFQVTNPVFAHLTDSKGRPDVYSMMILGFSNYSVAGAYVVAMAFLSLHLTHGASSWSQSTGISNLRLRKALGAAGNALALLLFAGYVSIPVCVYLDILKLW